MAEKEYIDRHALLDDLDAAMKNSGMGYVVGQTMKRYIKRVPVADVVEVVRCKDCVDYKCDTPYCQKHSKGYCDRDGAIKQREHYCAYGERKDQ